MVGVVMYAKAMGLLEARSFADLIILPGQSRVEFFAGERTKPLYSRIGFLLAYPGVVLALSYYYLYRWRWWLVLPMIGVVLLGMSESGRAGTMIILVQAVISVYLKNIIVLKRSAARILLKSVGLPGALMVVVFIGGQLLREGFRSTGIDDLFRVVNSLRAYLFGGVSAYSYWINKVYDWGPPTLGRYSFSSLFSVLGIFPQAPGVYDFYAPIAPNGETSNIYTAFRSFIDDFTVVGACLIYFMAGIVMAFITRAVIKGKGNLIFILIPLLSWLALSPMFSTTYFDSFLMSCILPYLLVRRISEVKNGDHQIHMR
jgi:oligosaccharide repeat unit polymerase